MNQFEPFPKIPRLNRDIVVTEKIDGTNASVWIGPVFDADDNLQVDPADIIDVWMDDGARMCMRAGSRTRWLQPTKSGDNFGFAKWVEEHAPELRGLGQGHHFGEWWGQGIQCGYGVDRRYFSLFNVSRWRDGAVDGKGELLPARPACCDVVPVLYEGPMSLFEVRRCISMLGITGSRAAWLKRAAPRPAESIAEWGYGRMHAAEGVIVYHVAARQMFKVTIENDGVPKALAPQTPKLQRVEANAWRKIVAASTLDSMSARSEDREQVADLVRG